MSIEDELTHHGTPFGAAERFLSGTVNLNPAPPNGAGLEAFRKTINMSLLRSDEERTGASDDNPDRENHL